MAKRLLSLDVMRGATIAAMILVNNPGGSAYAPLRHADWNGLTPTDLVFPFFLFIMGVSAYFSLSKYSYGLNMQSLGKIAKRFAVIFGIGLLLNLFGASARLLTSESSFGDVLDNIRIMGVLQRLALAYMIGSLIIIAFGTKYILHIATGILAGYSALLFSGHGHDLSIDNIIGIFDRWLLGENHLYSQRLADGSMMRFDPEGVLSTLGAVGHFLIGAFAGRMIANGGGTRKALENLMIYGTVLLFAGLLLSYGEPINKKIWSSTFVLTTCGFGTLFLGLLMWVIDVRESKKWAVPLVAFGMNPLFIYVFASVLSVMLRTVKIGGDSLKTLICTGIDYIISNPQLASLVYSLLMVGMCWLVCNILHRKKVYIKI